MKTGTVFTTVDHPDGANCPEANLEEVTMKTVCKQVYEKFPAHDLTERKDFIKITVKDIINQWFIIEILN